MCEHSAHRRRLYFKFMVPGLDQIFFGKYAAGYIFTHFVCFERPQPTFLGWHSLFCSLS